jgi:hypothetical protein
VCAYVLQHVPEGKSESRGSIIVYKKTDLAALKKKTDETFLICTLLAFRFLSTGDNTDILLHG